jgi:hypothetical protein
VRATGTTHAVRPTIARGRRSPSRAFATKETRTRTRTSTTSTGDDRDERAGDDETNFGSVRVVVVRPAA